MWLRHRGTLQLQDLLDKRLNFNLEAFLLRIGHYFGHWTFRSDNNQKSATYKCSQCENRGPQAGYNSIGVNGVGQPSKYLESFTYIRQLTTGFWAQQKHMKQTNRELTADLWASENPPTREAPRPQPWRIIPQIMDVTDFSNGNHLQGPADRKVEDWFIRISVQDLVRGSVLRLSEVECTNWPIIMKPMMMSTAPIPITSLDEFFSTCNQEISFHFCERISKCSYLLAVYDETKETRRPLDHIESPRGEG